MYYVVLEGARRWYLSFVQVNTAKAEAEMAYSLQAAKVQARIKEEEMQVKVVERQQNIAIQEQEIHR
jgi:flotillin